MRAHAAPDRARTGTPAPRAADPARAQAKPGQRVGPAGGAHERAADRAANQVLLGQSAGGLGAGTLPTPPAAVGDGAERASRVLAMPGEPLPASWRRYFEPRFGHDFSGVRLHRDAAAGAAASAIGAAAFTSGNHIALAPGVGERDGGRLIAHELAHVVQELPFIARQPRAAAENASGPPGASEAVVSLADHTITFATPSGTFVYALSHGRLPVGEFVAEVSRGENSVGLLLPAELAPQVGRNRFSWRIAPGQPDPATFLAGQSHLRMRIEAAPAAAPTPPGGPISQPAGTGVVPVFPIRNTRFGGASLSAWREGGLIRVRIPVHVWADPDFRREVSTLPSDVIGDGMLLAPDAPVVVRMHELRWYDPNLTGSTAWDRTSDQPMTAEGLLQVSRAGEIAVMGNIALTAIEALPFASRTVSTGLDLVQEALMRRFMGGARTLTMASMLGLRDAAPTATTLGSQRAVAAMVTSGGGGAGEQVLAQSLRLSTEAVATARPGLQLVPNPTALSAGTLARLLPLVTTGGSGTAAATIARLPLDAYQRDQLAFAARLHAKLDPAVAYPGESPSVPGSRHLRAMRILRANPTAGTNAELLRLLPEVDAALHNTGLVIEIATEAYGRSRLFGHLPPPPGTPDLVKSEFGRALLAMRGGGPIAVTTKFERANAFYRGFASVPRSIVDPGAGSAHGALAHLFQDLMLDRALARSGSSGRAFRGLLAGAEGMVAEDVTVGQLIWEMLLDDLEYASSEPNTLTKAIREALGNPAGLE